MISLPPALASRFVRLALDGVEREYPHVMARDPDAVPPRTLIPAFFGCYDWHSAVHSHWAIVRAMRAAPGAAFHTEARRALSRSLTPANIVGELAYVGAPGHEDFEVPYGLAWLLQLAADLATWDDADARAWSAALAPLEQLAAERLLRWIDRLRWPDRSGEHSQSAFAIGLVIDWARTRERDDDAAHVAARARELHAGDRDGALHLEPSGTDFLSPCLAAADLLRRVLAPGDFAAWLTRFLPSIELEPVVCPDPSDGKLAHLDGLNLSRAWMLAAIARKLPDRDPRRDALAALSARHLDAGLAAVTGEHYAGSHWLGSYAVYALTAG